MISWMNPNLGVFQNWVFEIVPDCCGNFWIVSKREGRKLLPIAGDKSSDQIQYIQSYLQEWLVNRLREEKRLDGKDS